MYKCKFNKRTCIKCSIEFQPYKETQTRCSVDCQYELGTCPTCNIEFKFYHLNHKTFCSKICSGAFRRKNRISITCSNCKKEYECISLPKSINPCCSRKCKDEYQKILFSGSGNPNFGNHSLLGFKHTQEQNQRCKEKVLESWETDDRREKHDISRERYKKLHGYYPMNSPETKKKIKENRLLKMSTGEYEAKTRGICGYYISEKTNNNEYYHSSWELCRMKELDADSNVGFWTKKHGIRIDLGNGSVYIPDFFIEHIDGSRILEEVKGYIRDPELFKIKCESAYRYCKLQGMQYIINFMDHMKNKKCPRSK